MPEPKTRDLEGEAKAFFQRYAAFFNEALAGTADLAEAAGFYATAFIAASPAGVFPGRNDQQLQTIMQQGFARNRQIGTREMRLRAVRYTPIDERHGIAHAAWTAVYDRADKSDVAIDFDVHYLMQHLEGPPKIFGWIAGDEEAALKEHGII